MDLSLLSTFAVIFMLTVLGAYLRTNQRDRCLQSFDGFDVTIEKKNGRVVWGVLHLTPTGMELMYRSDVYDEKHIEASYILYRDEYRDIQTIFRYVDQLPPEDCTRRNRDLEHSFHPGPWRRLGRSVRNFLATAADSLGEVFNLMLGRARAKATAHTITEGEQKYLSLVGKNIIGYVGTNYDPLLERHVGTKCVVEVTEGDTVYEYVGVFKDYSADFLEMLDVYYPESRAVTLTFAEMKKIEHDLEVQIDGRRLLVTNHSSQPLLLMRLICNKDERELDIVLDLGNQAELYLDQDVQDAQLVFKVVRRVDMIVPRAHALIRHRAERYDPDRLFDIGVALRPLSETERREQRLRDQLQGDPLDAVAANALAGLLIQRGELDEAHEWLRQALENRERLPDHGARARQQLQVLEDRLQGRKRVV